MKAGTASAWIILLLAACAMAATFGLNKAPAEDVAQPRTYRWQDGPDSGALAVDPAIAAQIDAQLAAKGWQRASTQATFVLSARYVRPVRHDCTGKRCPARGALAVVLVDPRSHQQVWHGELEQAGAARPELLGRQLGQLFAAFPMRPAPR